MKLLRSLAVAMTTALTLGLASAGAVAADASKMDIVDTAVTKVPKETLEALGKDKAKLSAVLTYPVVPGRVLA